jgi:uncharacterized protein with GYD domain
MPTYLTLINFTDQGIRTVTETLDRAERAAELAQKHGARLERLYWTVGPYDLVGILEPRIVVLRCVLGPLQHLCGNLSTTRY